MSEITPTVAQLSEHYTEQICRRATDQIFSRAKQHQSVVGNQATGVFRDESTAALFAALACLRMTYADDVEEFKRLAQRVLDAVLDVPPPTGDER